MRARRQTEAIAVDSRPRLEEPEEQPIELVNRFEVVETDGGGHAF